MPVVAGPAQLDRRTPTLHEASGLGGFFHLSIQALPPLTTAGG
jgi:hypothetical protein